MLIVQLGALTVDFVAIDVETANANMSSICQVGVATYELGAVSWEWKSYVDPEDYFDGINVAIHGIDTETVRDAPPFPEVASRLYPLLDGAVAVCHTHFDRLAIRRAAERYGLREPDAVWLDSARVARRAWADCARKGYGLKSVCERLGYAFSHHDALEDAKASGYILLAAVNETGLDVEGWLSRVQQPVRPIGRDTRHAAIAYEGDPHGPLYGEVVVFTGSLVIPRREAAAMAASLGCHVAANVTRKTTVLVVGDQDIQQLAGHTCSSKHRKAQELIKTGQPIRILGESDFREMINLGT